MSDLLSLQQTPEEATISLTVSTDGVRRLTCDVFCAVACPAHPLSQEAKDAIGTFVLRSHEARCLVESQVDTHTQETMALLDPGLITDFWSFSRHASSKESSKASSKAIRPDSLGVWCSLAPPTSNEESTAFKLVRMYTDQDLLEAEKIALPRTQDAPDKVHVQLFCLRAGTECPDELDVRRVPHHNNDVAIVFIKPSTVIVVGSKAGEAGEDDEEQTVVCSRTIGGYLNNTNSHTCLQWTPYGQCAKTKHVLPGDVGDEDDLDACDKALLQIIRCRYNLKLLSLAIDFWNVKSQNNHRSQASRSPSMHALGMQNLLDEVLDRIDVAPEDAEIYFSAKKEMQTKYQQ